MPCGTILRQALQYDTIAAVILYDESQPGEKAVQLKDVDISRKQSGRGVFWEFFTWINKGSFEVSADAFTTFRVCSLLNLVVGFLSLPELLLACFISGHVGCYAIFHYPP